MKLNEFLVQFAETHQVQHIDELNGTIKSAINKELYLVDVSEVSER